MKQQKVKSLSRKLTIRVTIIALVILLVAIVATQLSSNASFWTATEESIGRSTSIAARDINSVFTQAETLLTTVSNNIAFMPIDEDLQILQGFLYNARSPYSFVSEIYVGITSSNEYVDGAGYVPPPEWTLTQRPYYIGAMGTSEIFYQDPYLSSTGEIFSSIATRLVNRDGETIGVTVLDISLNTLLDMLAKSTIPGTTASAFLLDSNHRILAHQNTDFMPTVVGGQAVYTEFGNLGIVETENITQGSSMEPSLARITDFDGVEKYMSTVTLPGSGWTFGFAVPVSDFAANLNTSSTIAMYAVIIIVALIGIFFASQFLLIRPLKPITQIVETAKMLAIGKTPKPLKVQTDDELGELANDFNSFIESTQEQVSVLSKMADGDFTSAVNPKSSEDVLSNAINRVTENIRELITEISSSSSQVSLGAKHVSDGATALAQGATEQAASIEQLSASISQIEDRTKSNAKTAEQTSKLSSSIKDSAEKGSHQMDDMIAAVGEINEASKSISNIIKTIDDIAFQTNILALNAAVEAARAGQHGKGFAVVAEEVRNLASKSADAARDTGTMIQNSMTKSELGVRIAEETATSFKEIVSGINEASVLISDITTSSEEQSDGISQINIGIEQVAQVIHQNSATAEESAAASHEMSDQSDILAKLISQFNLQSDIPRLSSYDNVPKIYE